MSAEGLPEFAVAGLAEVLDSRGRTVAADRVWQVYDRMVYTDRGPAPSDAEVAALALEVAPGLEFDRRRLEWVPRLGGSR